jgi:PAS domain-containing protein
MGDAFKDADVALRAYDAHTDLGNVAVDIAKNLTRGARTEGQFKEMVGPKGYGLYLIQQEADPLGKKAPKTIVTKLGGIYNKEGELGFTQKLDFLKLIKDDKELQDEIQQAFKDDPTGTKALEIASSDPQKYYKIDFDDEIKREELFELRYQSMASTRPDLFILRDGKYVPRKGKSEKIAELNLDRDTLRIEFNQRIEDGLKLGQGELDSVGLDSVYTLVPDDQKQNYINLFDGDNSEFIKLFGAEISQSDSNRVNLGKYDLNKVFPNMGLTGTYELIWDTKSNRLLFK